MKFIVEQIALCPPHPKVAIELLTAMGLAEWARDHVTAAGFVFGENTESEADLAFNYDATSAKPLELEVLHYTAGNNWMKSHGPSVSHLGMHCTADELEEWRSFFFARGIGVAQEVFTKEHTNPVISGKRWYTYAIFDTRPILGVDIKFIVRRDSL